MCTTVQSVYLGLLVISDVEILTVYSVWSDWRRSERTDCIILFPVLMDLNLTNIQLSAALFLYSFEIQIPKMQQ